MILKTIFGTEVAIHIDYAMCTMRLHVLLFLWDLGLNGFCIRKHSSTEEDFQISTSLLYFGSLSHADIWDIKKKNLKCPKISVRLENLKSINTALMMAGSCCAFTLCVKPAQFVDN